MGSNSTAGFPDLNPFNGPTSTFKPIIPKLEPLDEPPPGFHLSAPSSISAAPSDAHVYSEFQRITELFRTALSQRLQNYGDVTVLPDSDTNSRAIVPHSNSDNAAVSGWVRTSVFFTNSSRRNSGCSSIFPVNGVGCSPNFQLNGGEFDSEERRWNTDELTTVCERKFAPLIAVFYRQCTLKKADVAGVVGSVVCIMACAISFPVHARSSDLL